MNELPDILALALGFAHEAGQLVLSGFQSALEVRSKGKSDLVTEFDERSEALLRARIAAAFPQHGFVGEESEARDTANHELVWYVDPIDGTSNFAHGHPFFCIALGLIRRGELGEDPILGVVHAPALGLTYSGAKGLGAHREGPAGRRRLRVSSTSSLEDSLLATGFPSNRASSEDNNYRRFLGLDSTTHGVRRCGAGALEIALVADGAYDAFWDLRLKPWDITAGTLLVREAGGTVTNLDGTQLDLHAGQFAASNGALHSTLVRHLTMELDMPAGIAPSGLRSSDGVR